MPKANYTPERLSHESKRFPFRVGQFAFSARNLQPEDCCGEHLPEPCAGCGQGRAGRSDVSDAGYNLTNQEGNGQCSNISKEGTGSGGQGGLLEEVTAE